MPITQDRMIALVNAAASMLDAYNQFKSIHKTLANTIVASPQAQQLWAEYDQVLTTINAFIDPSDIATIQIEAKHFRTFAKRNEAEKWRMRRFRAEAQTGDPSNYTPRRATSPNLERATRRAIRHQSVQISKEDQVQIDKEVQEVLGQEAEEKELQKSPPPQSETHHQSEPSEPSEPYTTRRTYIDKETGDLVQTEVSFGHGHLSEEDLKAQQERGDPIF